MKSFIDTTGRAWNVVIDLPHARNVRDKLKIDLLDPDVPKTLGRLALSAYDLVDVAYVLCEEQAIAADISDKKFGESLADGKIQDAYEAIEGALLDFFPSRRRELAKRMLDKGRELQGEMEGELRHRIDTLTVAKLKKAAGMEVDRLTSGDSATNSPAKSESTPEASPSES